ncbi:DegT/DnrJ/EryC1/StrS family aminotransferase [Pelagibacterales bacterium SAG-MED34]|nr:DegT/DnrJ/EryC1/StrS family aminotransferase [Pelagibacterales bacterium SAG-MED34]
MLYCSTAGKNFEKNIDYGFYSFGIMKHLCTFNGGAIYCKDYSKFYEIEQNLNNNINYPIIKSLKLVFFCILIDIFYSKYVYNFFTHHILKLSINRLDKLMNPNVYPHFPDSIPDHYKYKFQNSFAIAGIENLKNYEAKIDNRIKKVRLYEYYLDKSLRINNFNNYKINSFLEFPILLKKKNNKFLHNELLKKGYDIRHTWYVNITRYLKLNFNLEDFNNCEYLHKKILSLPTHDKISENDVVNICKLINFYEKN